MIKESVDQVVNSLLQVQSSEPNEYSDEEIAEMKIVYEFCDTNGDGLVTFEVRIRNFFSLH